MKDFYHDELVELPVVSYFSITIRHLYITLHVIRTIWYNHYRHIQKKDIFKTNKSEGSLLVSSNPLLRYTTLVVYWSKWI